jgi:hypothetical protein
LGVDETSIIETRNKIKRLIYERNKTLAQYNPDKPVVESDEQFGINF